VDNGRLYFDNVRIPRENLLDRYASVAENGDYDSPISGSNKRFFTMLGTLVGGRISVGAASVTAAKKSLAIATRYATVRRQFGGADGSELRIIDYKTHQMRLFPAIAHTYAMHFAAFDLIARFRDRTDETAREVETLAAGIKSMASWHAIDATQTARECCGGLGFLTENQIATIRRDIDVFATFEGDNTVLLNLVSKNRLASFAKGFEQNLALTLVRELTSMARTELIDINPLTARKTDEDHLRSADFHLELLKLRKHNLLVAASRRLYKRVQQEDMEPFMAFSDIQDHMMAFAHADMDHHIAKTFADVVEPLADGPEKDALERMRQLAAIDTLLKHAEWYLTYGYISSGKYKALRNLRGALLGEIRPDALAYIEAFGIPDELLSAPIAFENYVGREPLKQAPRGERP
jgi:acyl-CoA oxidase